MWYLLVILVVLAVWLIYRYNEKIVTPSDRLTVKGSWLMIDNDNDNLDLNVNLNDNDNANLNLNLNLNDNDNVDLNE